MRFTYRLNSTPAERTVIFWVLVLICLGLGVALLYLGWTAPADRAESAATAQSLGGLALSVGIGLMVLRGLLRWALDQLL